jgi:predicted permease
VRRISPIVVGKLLYAPLADLPAAAFPAAGAAWLQVAAVLFACAPMMSIYPIMGQKYGHEGLCAATLLAATVTSFFPSAACFGYRAEAIPPLRWRE